MRRAWLLPLAPLYASAAAAKNFVYDRGWSQPRRLRWPVVSVGNLSAGGSGKTPLVMHLAGLLTGEGIAVDVLSRGYGRRSGAAEIVDATGMAERFGDEPLLIARRTGLPVFVGASRFEAGLLAENHLPAGSNAVHVLDDGFQHRKLARNADIVVVHRSDFAERLLPAGNLREPLSALRRASAVVIREEDAELEAKIRSLGVTAPVWRMRRYLELSPIAMRCLAFCGIARPEDFFSSLVAFGVELIATRVFRDHHSYSGADMQQLAEMASAARAQAFVITEKDHVRLTPNLRKVLESAAPVHVAKLSVTLHDEESVVERLLTFVRLR